MSGESPIVDMTKKMKNQSLNRTTFPMSYKMTFLFRVINNYSTSKLSCVYLDLYITKSKLPFCFNNVFRLPMGISSIHKNVNWRTRKVFEGLYDLQSFFKKKIYKVKIIFLTQEDWDAAILWHLFIHCLEFVFIVMLCNFRLKMMLETVSEKNKRGN